MRYEIRELNVGGILDQAIKLVMDKFWLLLAIAAVLYIPYSVISGLLIAWNLPDMSNMSQSEIIAAGSGPGLGLSTTYLIIVGIVALVGGLIIHPLTDAAMIFAFGNAYLEKPITVGSALSRAFRIFLPLLGTWILFWLAVFGPIAIGFIVTAIVGPIGFVLVLVFGIAALVFAFWFMLAGQIVVIEGIAGTAALSRSKQLMKSNIGTAFVLGIVMAIIGGAMGWVSQLIPQLELQVIFQSVMQGLLTIFSYAAWVVFYFSCRCKVENFDLQMLADAVATDEPPAAR